MLNNQTVASGRLSLYRTLLFFWETCLIPFPLSQVQFFHRLVKPLTFLNKQTPLT